MSFLNVEVQGLSGAPHPALLNITSTQDALKLRHHLKFLCGDYLTGERLALQHGSNPKCKLCPAPIESMEHVLTNDIKERMLPELLNTVVSILPACEILTNPHLHLTQFLLDCTSVNLILIPKYKRSSESPAIGAML